MSIFFGMTTSSWTHKEAASNRGRCCALTPAAPNGTLRPYTTTRVVRADGELYVRSAGGADRPCYRHALASRTGRIKAAGIESDLTFAEPSAGVHLVIDAAYHKYGRYGPSIVGHVTGPSAHPVTVRLQPADGERNAHE